MTNDQKTTQSSAEGSDYWLTVEQYNGDTDFAKRAESEFLSSPYASEDGKNGFARRDFLKLMGASIAMATTACIRRPVQRIIPYAQNPAGYTEGIANFYASSWFDGVEGYGLLVKTMDGRPIKLEGNPLHPMNLGSLPARAHAEVLSLYDPDRLKGPTRNLQNKNRTNREPIATNWNDLDTAITEALGKGGVAILSSTLPQPSTRALIGDFQKSYGGTRWVQYDALPVDAIVEGQRRSYGKAVLPRYRFDQAKMIVSIDADFLGTHLSSAEHMKQWAKIRKPGPGMARLVSFESVLALTGMNADDRFRIKASQQLDVVMGLAYAAAKASGGAIASDLQPYADVPTRLGIDAAVFNKIGAELWAARGTGLVLAGAMATANAVDVQVAVNALNSMLGNDGKTIDSSTAQLTRQGSTAELTKLVADMQAGTIKTLIIHNLNPAYVLPQDSGFLAALGKVPLVVYTGNFNDETGKRSDYVLPSGNTLESWGDYEFQTGLYSIQQPTIRPLHDSRSFEESLLAWTQKAAGAPARAKNAKDWYEYVVANWRTEVFSKAAKGTSFEDFWQNVLQTGVVDTSSGRRSAAGGASRAAGGGWPKARAVAQSGYELALYSTVQLADGRYANVPWLQELPDPVTKTVWDNYAMISPAMARKEHLQEGDMITLSLGQGETAKSVNVPVYVQPGSHDEVIALALGYGRPDAGRVAKDVGVNGFALASIANGFGVFAGLAASFKKTGERYKIATTQHHHVMEGRQIVADATNAAFQKDGGSGIHRHHVFSIWPAHQYNRARWAMSVDLNACTGCSACVIACQSENNVPVVGKKYVMEGREMHWIRIDRYMKGTPDAPEAAVFMPLMCQHCETAPCETVCPVLATVHNDEGLNDMVYNRCVGTRYCSNNCPYKVRRFNWFNFSKREAPTHMALNPDVTVRTRGVMEKCTFCVQRIRHAQTGIGGVKRPEKIKDGEIKTACQETCPTDAIIFGDLNDPDSRVRKLFEEKRSYALLEDLNTQPRVRYMSRIRNSEHVVADAKGNPVYQNENQEHGHGHDAGGGHAPNTEGGHEGGKPEVPPPNPQAAPHGAHGMNSSVIQQGETV